MAKDEMMSITEDRWDEEIWGAATTMIDNTRTNISGPGTTRNRSTGDRHSLRATDPSTSPPPPKLIFYFAEKDHWVAANTRDELIAARGTLHYDDDHGQEEKQQSPPNDSYTKDNQWSRPRMMIDKGGVPHGFCISHSELMAGKVSKWIIEMIRADLDEQEGNLTGNGNGSKISKDP
ncbi:MAG: hypothetical protein M1817_005041 [Caeruleum heppii]|nr:MAG: hypothetical protein M1817_005041 [Caeruleum heppii]